MREYSIKPLLQYYSLSPNYIAAASRLCIIFEFIYILNLQFHQNASLCTINLGKLIEIKNLISSQSPKYLLISAFLRAKLQNTCLNESLQNTNNTKKQVFHSVGRFRITSLNFAFNITYLSELIKFYSLWNHQKTMGFLLFVGRIEVN